MTDSSAQPEPNFAKIDKLVAQIEKDPRSKDFLPLAEEYVKAGMFQEAALTLEDGLKVYPSFVTALVRLGGVYLQLKDYVQAQNRLEEAITNSPDNILAHRLLAKIHMLNHHLEQARQSCDTVLRENPFDKEMLDLQQQIDKAAGQTSSEAVSETSNQESLPVATLEPMSPHHDAYTSEATASPVSEEQPASPTHPNQQRLQRLSQLLARIQGRRAA